MAQDAFGRIIRYLRISLTDMCNLRCVYCMPEDMSFRPGPELMQEQEITRMVDLFAGLGFNKVRLTGGEPTLREDLLPIVRHIHQTSGIETVALTTNGLLLRQLAVPLADAGLDRVNVSIDTLDPERFRRITRWGNLDDVLDGIRAAEEAGLRIKLNVVVVRGVNDTTDVMDLVRLTRDNAWQVRFIELMPFGSIAEYQQDHVVPEATLRERIESSLGPLELQDNGRLDGEARVFRLAGAPGTVGFISSVTAPFCAGCNRVRLTPDGKLRLCLLRDREVDLLTPMRSGKDDEALREIIKGGIHRKPWGHGLAQNVHPEQRVMSEIGG